MTPEDILQPLLTRVQLPESIVRLLYHLLLRDIEQHYPARPYLRLLTPEFVRDDYINRLASFFQSLPQFREKDASLFTVSLSELAGISPEERYYITHPNARAAEIRKDPPPVTVYHDRLWHDLFTFKVSFDLPHRNEHCHILGAPGTGKTELIKHLAYLDIQSGASVIVIAPKDNICEVLARVPSDRTLWVSDWSQVGLNLLDLDASLLVYVFESLLESEPTPKQKAFISTLKAKTLAELREKIKHPSKTYAETAEQIAWRLDLLPPIVDDIFSRETNIDIDDVMRGKVLLLDTKPLKEGSPLIGRFFLALIAKATERRTTKNPCYVYIDEAPLYLSEYVEALLDRARSANVGLTLAHQTLAHFSPRLKASVHNTALKFCGRVNHDDATEMAKHMNTSPDVLKNQPRLQFMLSAFRHSIPITIKPGAIDRLATSHREHFTSPRPAPVDKVDSEDAEGW